MFYNFGCLLISRAGFRSENLKRVLWEDMSLLAIIVCTKNRAITGTYGPRHKRLTPGLCYEDNYFPKRKCKLFYSCFSQCTLFFLCFLLPICLPWVICGKLCNETSRQVTTDRMSIRNNVLVKQNRSSRQSRCVATTCTVARKVGLAATGKVKTSTVRNEITI